MRDVVMNDKTNLLQLEEHFYQLVDVDEPNTFRNLFPYEEIPKIAFNDRIVPHNMPEDIWITDTTFRDGQQSRAPYTTEQIQNSVNGFLFFWGAVLTDCRQHGIAPVGSVWKCTGCHTVILFGKYRVCIAHFQVFYQHSSRFLGGKI